jgi:two-component system, NarL family, response regulator NreC
LSFCFDLKGKDCLAPAQATLTPNLSSEGIMSIRIILADEHRILQQGLKALIESQPDLQVVGEAGEGLKTLLLVRELSPDVVIIEVKLPNLNGIEVTRQILSEFPAIKIIVLSTYVDNYLVTNMLKAGAQAYLLKDCSFAELAGAVRLVMANKSYLSPEVAKIVAEHYGPLPRSRRAPFPTLTPREQEVLQLLAGGQRTRQIAHLLRISVKTVDSHCLQIKQKLGLRGIADLTKYALRQGLTSLEN